MRPAALILIAALALVLAACPGPGDGPTPDAGPDADVDAGSPGPKNNDGAVPFYVDELDDFGIWPGWECTSSDFSAGLASEDQGSGFLLPASDARMDCRANADIGPNVDVLFDTAFNGSSSSPVGTSEAIVLSVRRHRIGGGLIWTADELDIVLKASAEDALSASFIVAESAREAFPDFLATAPAATATSPTPLVDTANVARVRVRAEGLAPTHLRLKVWRANDAEPAAWLIDAPLDGDAHVSDSDFGIAFSVAAPPDATDPAPGQLDRIAVYDAATTTPDAPLPAR